MLISVKMASICFKKAPFEVNIASDNFFRMVWKDVRDRGSAKAEKYGENTGFSSSAKLRRLTCKMFRVAMNFPNWRNLSFGDAPSKILYLGFTRKFAICS